MRWADTALCFQTPTCSLSCSPQYQREMQQKVADYLLDAPFIFLPLIYLKRLLWLVRPLNIYLNPAKEQYSNFFVVAVNSKLALLIEEDLSGKD